MGDIPPAGDPEPSTWPGSEAPAILVEEPSRGTGPADAGAGGSGNGDAAPAGGVDWAELDTDLRGRRVLIVDDDVRNVFALTSVLEEHGMEVLYAENGQLAISLLDPNPDVDLVLMDIMMPGMDGYATTDTIRRRPEFADLPIIALTAKAMKGDREKALAAGASDYVTKPDHLDHLLTVIRSWLTRPTGASRAIR